ncbi:hypothetical protein [Leptolyngbya sp. NIES-2104]|uniref:hypothetical protein n=1 Tax=Leptolyngbya sp. NIES-2104 TaxID=1552121 RepID=UPI0006ECB58D|nr:hypothetical protein [Leptolyngbya sp. NIES-2104]GAP95539.1 hypothetical protein NIES2104_20610 [Leptolyngbya sp. NIES-2104]
MSREVPEADIEERLTNATIKPEVDAANEELLQSGLDAEDSTSNSTALLSQAAQLSPKAKVALIRKLIAQLESDHIQAIVEFGLKEIGSRHRPGTSAIEHNTRLLLKKDYSYQTRGLTEPTQYFVYLRRRKPKLDRYIGALFHVPQGCTLSYFLDTEERLIFNPPYNVFELRDSKTPGLVQTVRLICLEPPPPDYTFDKQQNDVPDIQLHLEYLNPQTYQPLSKQTYPFPKCMYEGGELDRYRWEVKAIELSPELSVSSRGALPTSVAEPLPTVDSSPNFDMEAPSRPESIASPFPNEGISDEPQRRVLEVQPKLLTFHLSNQSDADGILKRIRLWVAWSEKAMPQSRWEIHQDAGSYTLMNARFKRRILRFTPESGTIVLENSLPVLMRWFHDLSLAVSQSQNRRQYSAAQLKLAHTLFIEMSLPQTDPAIVLKKLFGVDFSKAAKT